MVKRSVSFFNIYMNVLCKHFFVHNAVLYRVVFPPVVNFLVQSFLPFLVLVNLLPKKKIKNIPSTVIGCDSNAWFVWVIIAS